MIAQISVSWNEKYEHDGFLFFAQRIVEMLDYMTVDIYRAPLLNTSRLIDEYLRICHGAAKPYHLEEVYTLVHIRQGGSDPTYRPATVSIVVHTDQVFFLHGKVHFHTSNSFFLVLAAAFFGLAACLLSVSCLRIEGRGLRIDASRRSSLPIMAYTPCRSFMPVKHRDL